MGNKLGDSALASFSWRVMWDQLYCTATLNHCEAVHCQDSLGELTDVMRLSTLTMSSRDINTYPNDGLMFLNFNRNWCTATPLTWLRTNEYPKWNLHWIWGHMWSERPFLLHTADMLWSHLANVDFHPPLANQTDFYPQRGYGSLQQQRRDASLPLSPESGPQLKWLISF